MNTKKEHKGLGTVKEVTKEVMQKDLSTRECDWKLMIQVARKYGVDIYMDLRDINKLPSLEGITRCRRQIQNRDEECLSEEQTIKFREKQRLAFKEKFR